MFRILVVEDDRVIADKIKIHLERWGYQIECVADFANVLSHFNRFLPELVLMDIGLPFYNGYYWCGEIRKISQVPIIFISSASDNMNVVMAINMGGDDFIVKPFDLEILSAKVQAILRRAYSIKGKSSLLEHNGVILSLGDMTLLYEEQKLELTKNEFRIIQILFENAGNVVSRENIMKRLWDNECFVDENTLTVNINRLRKRLEDVGLKSLILTRKGVGYQLEE
ncbi:MAG: response regulator transcription factor [Lachnospiraceae bacterium]|nr:response regulator transcription factor [Lachnospiraceae bacterium]